MLRQSLETMPYELTDFERAAIKSFIANKPRGVPYVDDRRRVLMSPHPGSESRCPSSEAPSVPNSSEGCETQGEGLRSVRRS